MNASMNTSFCEKNILGILFQYPELIPVVRGNINGLFADENCRIVWREMDDRQDRGDPVNIAIIYDLLYGKIQLTWIMDTLDGVFGIAERRVEKRLMDTIKFIKEQRKGDAFVKFLGRERTTLSEIDKKELDMICEEAEIKTTNQEETGIESAIEEYNISKSQERTRVTLGFPTIDRATDDFNYGEVVAIMGRTTTGKTFVALHTLSSLVVQGVQNIGFFSMEMSKAALVERMAQIHFGLSRQDVVLRRDAKEIDFGEVSRLYRDVKILSQVYSAEDIARIVEKKKLKVIFIDYLQLMKGEDGNSIYEKTTYKMNEIKTLAKNQNCVVFLLVQISRKGEGGWEAVSIDMARDSGAIEENSDFIIGLWNPSLKDGANEEYKNRIRMKLLKNKRGPVKAIECVFNPETGKLYEV